MKITTLPYKFAFLLMFIGAAWCLSAKEISIETANGEYHVKTPKYEALIAADGCLTSLSIGGREFLKPVEQGSCGSYFYFGGRLKLPLIEQSGNVITAKGEQAAIRYEFGEDSMVWLLENLEAGPMPFYIIFDPAVSTVMDKNGDFAQTPVEGGGGETVWFREQSRLEVDVSDRLWPWRGNLQVLEVMLAPNGQARITLNPGVASPEEDARRNALTTAAPMVEKDLTILSPRDHQVFQRGSRGGGRAVISGRVVPDCDAVEARITGRTLEGALPDSWQPVPWSAAGRSFLAEQPLAAGGWYRLELCALKAGKVVAPGTVVFFASDNGGVCIGYVLGAGHHCNGPLLGQKTDAWTGGNQVPFLVRWPGKVPAGKTSDAFVSLTDIMATVAAATGVEAPESAIDSLNQLPVFLNPDTDSIRSEMIYTGIFGQGLYSEGWVFYPFQGSGGMTAHPTQKWGQPYAKTGMKNSDLDAAGKLKPDAPPAQLYHVAEDPGQTRNVCRENPERAAMMKQRLDEFICP